MDVKAIFERNSERLHKLYGGADQYPRYEKLAEDFRAHFGREPELFVSAPGRTEVIGNHTDHNRGASTRRGTMRPSWWTWPTWPCTRRRGRPPPR